jgi:exonuclease VII small subunit
MRPHLPIWLLAAFLLSPCGCDRDHSRKLERVKQSLESWDATLDETTDQWARGRVPSTYVRQLADAAGRSLEDEAESLAKVPADDPRGKELRQRLDALRQRSAEVSRAANEGGHRP